MGVCDCEVLHIGLIKCKAWQMFVGGKHSSLFFLVVSFTKLTSFAFVKGKDPLMLCQWRHDNQHNDTQHKDIQYDVPNRAPASTRDGVTNPEYKLLLFIQLPFFLQRDEGMSF